MIVWLTEDIREGIEQRANSFYPLETGGMLLGWRDGDERVVAGLVESGPQALHGRHAFLPDHRWQMERFKRVFSETNGDLDYLGDWHTHPDGAATMSTADVRTLRRIAGRVRKPIMVIAAGDPTGGWSLGAWMQAPRGRLFRYSVPDVMTVRAFEPPGGWPSGVIN